MIESTPAPSPSAQSSEDDEISILDLLQVVADNLRLLVFGPLAVGIVALAISFMIAPTFTATAVIMPPQQQQTTAALLLQNLGALGGAAGAVAGLKNPNDQFVSLLQSRSVQDALIKRFKLMDRYEAEFPEDAREELSDNAKVIGGKDGLISISVDDHDPAFAAELANAHVAELADLLGRLAITEAQQRRVFFEAQLTLAKDGLIKAEQALLSSGVSANVIKSSPGGAVGGIASLQASITAKEITIAAKRGYLAEGAPELRQELTELSALRAQLKRAEQSQNSSSNDNAYVAKFRDFKYYETLFELFAKQYELARADESREGAVMQVVDTAIPPEKKSKPKKGLIAVLVTLASGFALLLFVFVRHSLRESQKDAESHQKLKQIRRALRGALSRKVD